MPSAIELLASKMKTTRRILSRRSISSAIGYWNGDFHESEIV